MEAERACWQRLQDANLVARETAVPAQPKIQTSPDSWAIRLLAGLGGLWAGGFFISALIGLFSLAWNNATAHAGLALACFAAAIVAYRASHQRNGVFLPQFALSLSLAGQGLVLMACNGAHLKDASSALILGGVQGVLLFVIAHPLHRMLCTLILAGCVSVLANEAGHIVWAVPIFAFALALLWQQSSLCRRFWEPLHLGVTIAVLVLALALSFKNGMVFNRAFNVHVVRAMGGLSAIGLWLFICLNLDILRSLPRMQAVLLLTVPALSGIALPPLLLCLCAAVMALAVHRHALALFSVVGMVVTVALYYYGRETTLMIKAVEMWIVGGLFLVLAIVLQRQVIFKETQS